MARTLSDAEFDELGRRVLELMNENENPASDPQAALRNDTKSFVLVGLADMGLLPLAKEKASGIASFRTAS